MIATVCFSVLILSLFVSILLLSRYPRTPANRWLAAFLVGLAIAGSSAALSEMGLEESAPWAFHLLNTVHFLLPPFLFAYVRSVAGRTLGRRGWLHILPFAVILTFRFTFILPHIITFPDSGFGSEWIASLFLIQALMYHHVVIREIRDHAKRLKQGVAEIEHRDLNWLLYMVWSLGGLWLLFVVNLLVPLPFVEEIGILGALAFFFGVGWLGLRQETAAQTLPEAKYQHSGMSEQDSLLIAERLVKFIEGRRDFLKPGLTLSSVSQIVGCSPHWMSQYLNHTLKTTFFDYINGLRLSEFMKLATDPTRGDRTNIELAFESGFQSKSTFNTVFKKKVGMTPTAWRKQILPSHR